MAGLQKASPWSNVKDLFGIHAKNTDGKEKGGGLSPKHIRELFTFFVNQRKEFERGDTDDQQQQPSLTHKQKKKAQKKKARQERKAKEEEERLELQRKHDPYHNAADTHNEVITHTQEPHLPDVPIMSRKTKRKAKKAAKLAMEHSLAAQGNGNGGHHDNHPHRPKINSKRHNSEPPHNEDSRVE